MKTCIQVAPIRIATYLLVMSLAIGCGNRHQPTIGVDSPAVGNPEPTSAQAQPTSEDDSMAPDASSNLFDNKEFPQKSCGDQLHEHFGNDYYVEFHPVFIDFSEENLQAVTSRFCEDAFKKYRENLGKNAIQVASFISRESAEQFKSLMVRELGSGDVGEVSIVSSKPQADSREADSSEPTKQPSASGKSPHEIGKMAKLTDSQIDTLIAMDSMEDAYGNDMSVVLPTYLPKFEVYSFMFVGIRGGQFGPDYSIEYWSSDNTCFTFRGGYEPPIGDAPTDQDLITVNSKALGEVKVLYTANSNDGGRLIIRFEPFNFSPPYMVRGKDRTSYYFQSPSPPTIYSQNDCRTIPIQEAVKIIESLEYLNAESTSSN